MFVEVDIAATFDTLHRRAVTSYTACARTYLGQLTDMRNRLKRWSTNTDCTIDEAEVDLIITINVTDKTVTNSKRELKKAILIK